MTEERQTKTCKVCYEPIDARAKKCPFCRQWQGPLHVLVIHPSLVMWLGLLPVVALYVLICLGLYRWFSTGQSFARHEGELRVVSSKMAWVDDESAPYIQVIGELENLGSVPWEDIQVEVQFTDSSGRLVDKDTNVDHATIAPHKRAVFTVWTNPHLQRGSYATCNVFVRWAKDARSSWF
jgi:hypothetical protein